MKLKALAAALILATGAASAAAPFKWENATVYFVLTDRFANGDKANDHAYGRKDDGAKLRSYAGGDFKGLTAKIKAGYFNELGVDALWITPPVEQIHAGVDEGQGKSYGFHGYWARDFTAIDASLGTEDDLFELVDAAHAKGLRVLLDVVMNHTGPVTPEDPVWPADWVRTGPQCTYKDAPTTIACTLVANLPDFLTESEQAVELPPALVDKWKAEGRYTKEVNELNAFFTRTGLARTPRNYLVKWHADWVRKYGFDGFRADTVKHIDAAGWKVLRKEAGEAYEDWKRFNPSKAVGNEPFYMTAELYGYNIAQGRSFDLGRGTLVDYYANGFDSMINFAMKNDAKGSYEDLFSAYSKALNGPLKGVSVLNYISSHDDGSPYDMLRQRPYEAGTKLLLAPGAAQIYYGDETARPLKIDGVEGDANLRSFMNWGEHADVRRHWAKLGQFRHAHPAIGAGVHEKLADAPYTFKRTLGEDKVVVALDAPRGAAISVAGVFADGTRVRDAYSGGRATVKAGKVRFAGSAATVLIAAD